MSNFTSWHQFLTEQSTEPYYHDLMQKLAQARTHQLVYPRESQVFRAFELTPFEAVKVVILGQDPYHGEGQAHGLAFSVPEGVPIPPSLSNIYKELSQDISGFTIPEHGCLEAWAKQGVLLLNSVLTVNYAQAASHAGWGWEQLTDAAIEKLGVERSNLVFMLWGAYAQRKGACIDRTKHLVLTSVHPSPLSAYRGFFGSAHFSKANAYLRQHGFSEIDWQLPSASWHLTMT